MRRVRWRGMSCHHMKYVIYNNFLHGGFKDGNNFGNIIPFLTIYFYGTKEVANVLASASTKQTEKG